MAHSFVEFHDARQHLQDDDIIFVAALMMEERRKLPASVSVPENIDQLFRWWNETFWSWGPGTLNPKLDEFLVDPESVRVFRDLLDRARDEIQKFGGIIPGADRDRIGRFAGCNDRPTKDIVRVIDRIGSLFKKT